MPATRNLSYSIAGILLFILCFNGNSQNLFVSVHGSNNNDGLTTESALASIQKAADLVNPGDTVFIMDGTYSSSNGPLLKIVRSGLKDQNITFSNYEGHSPVLTVKDNSWNVIVINGNYINIQGLELKGDNENLNYDDAFASYQSYLDGNYDWAKYAKYNASGINIGGPNDQSLFPHHVRISNCEIHDFPGGGISVLQADYCTIENNRVYNNAWYCMYANSGISILHPVNSDTVTGIYKMLVKNNIVYNNKTLIPWISTEDMSDGNGIIVDINAWPWGQPDSTHLPYLGKTLIANNLSYYNGGSGIHAFHALNVDIIHNTAWNNGQVVGYAEIFANQCLDNRIINNIMYARTGGKPNSNYGNENVVYDYNIYYNGIPEAIGPHDIIANPEFIDPVNSLNANFRLQASSPAIDCGSMSTGVYTTKDLEGRNRPLGIASDRGAYEFEPGDQQQDITFDPPGEKFIGEPDFDPGAVASSGLPVIYRSSNHHVAVVYNNKIQILGSGETTITATQPGNEMYTAAPETAHVMQVTGGETQNIITNSDFEAGTQGWSLHNSSSADAGIFVTTHDCFSGKALKTEIINGGMESAWDIQLRTAAPVAAGVSYDVHFRIAADSACSIDVAFQSGHSPYTIYKAIWNLQVDTICKEQSFRFTAEETDGSTLLKFLLAKCNSKVYLDDVNVIPVPQPGIKITNTDVPIPSGEGNYFFGDIPVDSTASSTFTITNEGNLTLNLLYDQKVEIGSDVFFLTTSPPATVAPGSSEVFDITFESPDTGMHHTSVSISSNALAIPLYTFQVSGRITDTTQVADTLLPALNLLSGTSVIQSGTGIYDYGNIKIDSSVSTTFQVLNSGEATLVLEENAVTITGENFSLSTLPPETISPNQQGSFEILFEPADTGLYSAEVEISSNDPENNPYTFSLRGKGIGNNMTRTPDFSPTNSLFRCYPNPASDNLFLQSIQEIRKLEIFHINGIQITSVFEPRSSIDISHLDPGLYLLKVSFDETSIRKIFVVK